MGGLGFAGYFPSGVEGGGSLCFVGDDDGEKKDEQRRKRDLRVVDVCC